MKKGNSALKKKKAIPYILLIPTIIFIAIIFVYPLYLTIKYSFYSKSALAPKAEFVGLSNYVTLFKNPEFLNSITRTIVWTLLSLSLKVSIGLALALLLNKKLRGLKICRTLVLISWAMPQVASTIIWSWIYDAKYGYLNYFFSKLGIISSNLSWLGERNLAFMSTVVVEAWMEIPFITLMILSALQSIPESMYEAAELDGASGSRKLISITLPQLKNILITCTTLSCIWTFNSFNVIWILTKGGPIDATETLPIKIYNQAFGKFNTGISSTMAVIVFIILSVFTIVYWNRTERKEKA